MTYRLLCKSSPCLPEVYCDFAGLQMMQRSFYKDKLYAIVPKPDETSTNESKSLYQAYLRSTRQGDVAMPGIIKRSFITYARLHYMKGGVATQRDVPANKLYAVGVRFVFELLDNYIGQFCTTFLPHTHEDIFYTTAEVRFVVVVVLYCCCLLLLLVMMWLLFL